MGRARPARGFPRGFPRLVRCVRGSKASNRTSRLGSDTGARASCCAAARPRRNEMLSRQQNVSKEWSRVVYNNTSSAGPHADVQELVAPLHRAVQLLELRPETHVNTFHRRAAHVPDA